MGKLQAGDKVRWSWSENWDTFILEDKHFPLPPELECELILVEREVGMIKFKKGVDVSGITRDCIQGMFYVALDYQAVTGRVMTVTSVCDGKHMSGSKHYEGSAFDFRTWTTDTSGIQISPDEKHDLAVSITYKLGKDWDVVAEKTHIHVEYDPK